MTGQDWGAAYARAVTVALSGATGDHTRPDDPFLILLNAWWEPLDFTIPESLRELAWQVEVDTSAADGAGTRDRPFCAGHADRPLAGAAAEPAIVSAVSGSAG